MKFKYKINTFEFDKKVAFTTEKLKYDIIVSQEDISIMYHSCYRLMI
jgi:hypothetical protein